jgi:hypothetical protein
MKTRFAAVHESACGTKRTFAAAQHFVRYWSNSGQPWILARDGLSANDPSATSDAVYCSLMEIFTGFLSVARLQNPPAIGRE